MRNQTLSNFTDQELLQEIERRKDLKTPYIIYGVVDDHGIREIIQTIVNKVEDGSYHEDNDYKQYLWEEVMKAYYGKDFFTWFNKIIR